METALACDDLAVLDSYEAALQYGFRFNLAGGVTGGIHGPHDAHQKDGARLELCGKNLVHVAAGLLGEILHGLFGNDALQLSKIEFEALELAGAVEEYAVDGAVEVIADTGALGAVREFGFREHEATQLHLQVADVRLQRALGRVLAPCVEGRHDFELCLAPVFDALFFKQFVEEVAVQLFFQAFQRGAHGKAEVAVVEFQRFRERLFHVFFFYIAFFDHAVQNVRKAFDTAGDGLFPAFHVALDERVVVERALDRARNEGALGEREVFEFLVEEVLGRDGHALARSGNVELVQVEFQDFFLGKVLFHAQRVQELLAFFLDAPFFAAEDVLDGLLREGGTALAHVPALEVRNHGAGKAVHAETVVVPVTGVFGGHQGVHDVDRDIAVGYVHAVVRVEEGAQEFVPVVIEYARFAGKDLQDGVAVKLVVRIPFGEDLEYEDVGWYTADDAD